MDDEERQAIINNIPECSQFEGQKENVMPRRQGRSAVALASVYRTTTQEREQQLQDGHDHFTRELEDIEEHDDPLDVYLRYIQWTVEMYPEGHNQSSDLRGLLEEATHRFQTCVRYQQDLRYLKCWIHHIEYLDNPDEAYQLLIRNNIGQSLTLFYEKYADYLESQRKYMDAMTIYNKGIEQQAHPIKRMIRKHKQFLERVDQQRREQQQNTTTMARTESINDRVPLALKYSSASASSSIGSSRPTSSASRQPQFSVYSDPDNDSNSAIPTSSTRSSSLVNNSTQRIENQPQVTQFAGTTLPQKQYQRPKPSSSFSVYRDDDPKNTSTRKASSAPQAPPYLQKRFAQYQSLYILSENSKGKSEYIAATKKCVGGKGSDVPISFEELRYRHYQKLSKNFDKLIDLQSKQSEEQLSDPKAEDPPEEQTQEGRAADMMLDSWYYAPPDDRDEEAISFSYANVRHKHTDENAMPTNSTMDISRQSLDFNETLIDTDDEDMDNAMRQEASKVPLKRPRAFQN
ncbi:Mad3/BUB1 homology region 1-domain-containing protein [Zychaea mexicana]|uniref:uncharacterized protein n=1 Tax=Zychaea mexicana TaxID=64656 RepID=UPI0022FE2842|nr:uncharacterized protein BDB00DRAFT_809459 [Zychaea mexicana]KAI9496197.1 Mad3/BUB1 homology region 1-domain-containing protein [Zychaea mexicana]